ncbi:uncharacterized protein FFE2_06491 [Fusarium fujikuroi]|nr:uncharacterized protein FFE2_06491 [Fusarium fujikuroi]
MRGVTS